MLDRDTRVEVARDVAVPLARGVAPGVELDLEVPLPEGAWVDLDGLTGWAEEARNRW
ncbi:hypothetical protein [Microbispora rosea]|uniref:hypothetical protein n=1 Tax=Microbispora rosea TaxID=58117 RepID=UPI003D91E417